MQEDLRSWPSLSRDINDGVVVRWWNDFHIGLHGCLSCGSIRRRLSCKDQSSLLVVGHGSVFVDGHEQLLIRDPADVDILALVFRGFVIVHVELN